MTQMAFRYRLCPTRAQAAWIDRNLGCCRWVYNRCLEARKTAWEERGEHVGVSAVMAMIPGWKAEFHWLAEADYTSLQQAARDNDWAFRNFFRRCKRGGKPGYPRFRSKRDGRQSYRTQNPRGRKTVEVMPGSGRVKLPKLGLVKARVSRAPKGRITSATVTRTSTGKYFVTILCDDVAVEPLPPRNRAVGVDLGVEKLAATSDGEVFENPKAAKKFERKLAREQRKLARKRKGSANYAKQRRRVALVHERAANTRRDAAQKATTRLVHESQVICCETLRPSGMVRNRHLAMAVEDAGMAEFLRELEYKCAWYGRTLVHVSPWYPSSQLCSACGHRQRMPLSERTYRCPECGHVEDRDVNAARNILAEGMRILSEGTAGHAGTCALRANASGEGVSPEAAPAT